MSIATKALSIIGGAAIKTIPFQQWGIGDGISGTSTFDRTWLPTQPGSAHNYREDAGDLLQNSVVAAGVSAVGQALGEAPPMLEERQGDNWVKVTDHPAIHKLNNPNGYYTMNHLWIAQAGSEITNGEGFWRITMNSQNEPAEIWWERPDMVRIIGDKGAFIDGYELMVNGIPYPVEAAINFKKTRSTDYMIHFRAALNHYNPRTGWSPLQAGYRQVVGDNAATTYHTSLMRNVTAVGLLISLRSQLENGQNITPDEFDAIKNKVNQIARGEGAGSTAAINLPVEVSRLGMTPDEMALDALISYYEYRIASLIGVDVMVLGLGSGTQQKTYANFAEAISDFQERRIVPTKNRQAEELRIQYLPLWGLDPEKYRIVWDYSKVPVMQENEDEKHNRIRADYVSGITDLFQTATLLGYEADESMKGVRYQGGQNAAPPTPEEIAQQKKLNNAAKSEWVESEHPRDADGKFGAGGSSPGVEKALGNVSRWLDESKVSEADRENAMNEFKSIYGKLTPQGVKVVNAGLNKVTFVKSSADMQKFQNDTYGRSAPDGKVIAGSFDGNGKMVLIANNEGAFSHEISHVLDVDLESDDLGRISDTPQWKAAWEKEFKPKGEHYYSASSPREGFAEFGRLLLGKGYGRETTIAAEYPKSYAVWKAHGLR